MDILIYFEEEWVKLRRENAMIAIITRFSDRTIIATGVCSLVMLHV